MSMEKFLKGQKFRNINRPDKGNRYYAVPMDEQTGFIERVGQENFPIKVEYIVINENTVSMILNSPFKYAGGILNTEKDLEFEPEEVSL